MAAAIQLEWKDQSDKPQGIGHAEGAEEAMILYRDLIGIPTEDCGEPLLPLSEILPSVIARHQQSDMEPFTGGEILLREGCIEKLRLASNLLRNERPKAILLIVYGYRHPTVQKKYFNSQLKRIQECFPELEGDDLLEEAHKFISVPSVAGHPTGGAVDLTVLENGVLWEMGTTIADFDQPEKIPTFSNQVTEKQKCCRLLLRSAMIRAGFAPFDGEWWHFSFGDKEWARYYKKAQAIYEQIDLNDID